MHAASVVGLQTTQLALAWDKVNVVCRQISPTSSRTSLLVVLHYPAVALLLLEPLLEGHQSC